MDIGYDIENPTDPERSSKHRGEVTTDHYGRKMSKHAHGTVNLQKKTSSSRVITQAVVDLYDRIVDRNPLIRRINIAACKLTLESNVQDDGVAEQLTLLDDPEELQGKKEAKNAALACERRMQKAVVNIKTRYGKNAILKGMNLQKGATAKDKNFQVCGHRA